MNSDVLSARHLSVAVLVGGLSLAAAGAGRTDWRWCLAAVPAGVLLGWLLLRRVGRRPLFCGVGGGVLAVLYGGWAVVLMADGLHRAAQRIQITNGSRSEQFWILLLIALPLFWMGWKKAAAFFRAVEIFWLAVVVLLAAILIFAVPRMEWRWLLEPAGEWWQSLLAGLGTMATGLFVLPYIYKVEPLNGDGGRGLIWLGGLGVLGAAAAAVTAGIFSPAAAAQIKEPFFVATGVLGESVRGEGLISSLWLLPDLTFVGLLSRVWGGGRRPAAAVAAAFALALTGITENFSPVLLSSGTVILLLLTLILPAKKGKIVVRF